MNISINVDMSDVKDLDIQMEMICKISKIFTECSERSENANTALEEHLKRAEKQREHDRKSMDILKEMSVGELMDRHPKESQDFFRKKGVYTSEILTGRAERFREELFSYLCERGVLKQSLIDKEELMKELEKKSIEDGVINVSTTYTLKELAYIIHTLPTYAG